ncbi:MAG: hypothetical protein HYX79_00140 [Chloroflexi bacterium]|nr:hypothetical protein [Chloroflexota bacterium]
MRLKRTVFILLFLLSQLVLAGCAAQELPSITASAPATQTEQETSSLQSRLQQVQDELASYKLIEQNWRYWEQIKDLLQKTLSGVSKNRQLPAPDKTEIRVVTADWAQARWGGDYVKGNSKKIEIDERIFKGLFVIPDNVSLSQLYSEWPRAYMLATLGDTVYFVQENSSGLDGEGMRKYLAHEVIHMLQGKSFQAPQTTTYDEEKAWAALIEGDAEFTSARYLVEVAQSETAPQLVKLAAGTKTTAPDLPRPRSLTRLLYFPYDYGPSFISLLHQRGNWQTVNQTYGNRPVSTSQIMHPEKYFAGVKPKDIEPLPMNVTGWKEEKNDRLGEHFTRVMLQNQLSEAQTNLASQGWASDRLTYYESQQSYLFTWQTAWDSNQDAAEFYEAFVSVLGKAGATPSRSDLWQNEGKYLWVRQTDGQSVLIIVSKEKSMVDAALDALNMGAVKTP